MVPVLCLVFVWCVFISPLLSYVLIDLCVTVVFSLEQVLSLYIYFSHCLAMFSVEKFLFITTVITKTEVYWLIKLHTIIFVIFLLSWCLLTLVHGLMTCLSSLALQLLISIHLTRKLDSPHPPLWSCLFFNSEDLVELLWDCPVTSLSLITNSDGVRC